MPVRDLNSIRISYLLTDLWRFLQVEEGVNVHWDSVEAIDYIDMNKRSDFTQYYIMNTLLIMLLILHIYWWLLIWRMLMKLLQNWGKVGDDVRSGNFIHSHHPLSLIKTSFRV